MQNRKYIILAAITALAVIWVVNHNDTVKQLVSL